MKKSAPDWLSHRIIVTPHLAATVVFWRKVRHLTQEELARLSGVALSTIKWIERGRKHGARTDTLELLCHALDITLIELFGGAEKRARYAAR